VFLKSTFRGGRNRVMERREDAMEEQLDGVGATAAIPDYAVKAPEPRKHELAADAPATTCLTMGVLERILVTSCPSPAVISRTRFALS